MRRGFHAYLIAFLGLVVSSPNVLAANLSCDTMFYAGGNQFGIRNNCKTCEKVTISEILNTMLNGPPKIVELDIQPYSQQFISSYGIYRMELIGEAPCQ